MSNTTQPNGAGAAPATVETPAATPAPAANAATPTPTPAPAAPAKATSLKELMGMADEKTRGQLETIIKSNTDRGNHLINILKDKSGLSVDELKAMDLQALERMASKLAPKEAADYSGAAPTPVANSTTAAGDQNSVAYTAPQPFFVVEGGKK